MSANNGRIVVEVRNARNATATNVGRNVVIASGLFPKGTTRKELTRSRITRAANRAGIEVTYVAYPAISGVLA